MNGNTFLKLFSKDPKYTKQIQNTNVNTSTQTVFEKSLLSLPSHVVVPFSSHLLLDKAQCISWYITNLWLVVWTEFKRSLFPECIYYTKAVSPTINQHSLLFKMQGKNFIQALLLICLLASCQGFWLRNKPRRSAPPPQNEIKTPVIIGNNCFLCHCKIVVSSIRFKTKQRTAPIDWPCCVLSSRQGKCIKFII